MQTTVKFRLAGGAQPLILVPARVNGRGPYEFILDTGAGISLLSPELAERAGVVVTETKEGKGAAGTVKVSLGSIESLAIGDCKVERMQVAITDELHKIGAVIGAKIDGNIGYNFLKPFRLTIDYHQFTLRLAQSEHQRGDASDAVRAKVKFRLAHQAKPLILVPAFVNGGGPYQFAVDTGASTTVVSPELAETLKIKSISVPEMTGAGGKMHGSAGAVESLAVGSAKLENLPIIVADFLSMLSQAIGTKLDGIIGYNYLKEFKVSIDYLNETLGLE